MNTRRFMLMLSCFLTIISAKAQNTQSVIKQADAAYMRGKFEESAELYTRAISMGAKGYLTPYNAARSFARTDISDSALHYLSMAVDMGWPSPENLEKEQAFKSLHEAPEWESLMEKTLLNKERSIPKEKMMNDLKKCAAYALQYRNKPRSAGGGDNSYYGFALSAQYSSNENGKYTAAVLSPDELELRGVTADGKGGITARVDRFGKLSNFIYFGVFK